MTAKLFFNSLNILSPIFAMLALLYLALFGQNILPSEVPIDVVPFGFFSFEYLVTQTQLRVICGVISAMVLGLAFLRDYSGFYPRVLRMRAMFDNDGLEKVLAAYQKDPRFDFDIYSDWKKMKRAYFDDIENTIMEKASKKVSLGHGGYLAAQGSTTFIVEKQAWLRQAYRVVEADGNLKMQDEGSDFKFRTAFNLLNTRDADIEVTLTDMLFRHTFLTAPEFSQTYQFESTDDIRFGDLVACSRARFFPVTVIDGSIYLVKGKQRWFPVGYCVYDY
jgi:hypothetical protein